jgi:trigger factor
MNVSVEDMGSCRKAMHIDVAAEIVAPDYEKVLNAYATHANIPGFRKGKAPAKIVEKKFKKNIEEDARQDLIPKFYHEALAEKKIKPVAIVDITGVDFDKVNGLKFDVILDVAPEFKLPKYKKISIKEEKIEVTDADVDEQVTGILKNMGKFEDVTDRGLEKDDLASIDYTATCDGVPLGELGDNCAGIAEGTDFMIMMGEPEYLPGMVDGLMGAAIGDKKIVNVKFPEDYRVKEVAGKAAIYDVEIKGIRAQVLPEIDEELLKNIGCESEDDLRGKIREQLEDSARQREKTHLHNEVAKFLLEKTSFDLPKAIVDQETNLQAREMVNQLSSRGMSRDNIETQRNDIMTGAVQNANNRVKIGYIVDSIAEVEGIEVEDSEVDARIDQLALQYRMTPEQFRAELAKRDNAIEGIKSEVIAGKVFDFLVENAKIK